MTAHTLLKFKTCDMQLCEKLVRKSETKVDGGKLMEDVLDS